MLEKARVGADHLMDFLQKRLATESEEYYRSPDEWRENLEKERPPIPPVVSPTSPRNSLGSSGSEGGAKAAPKEEPLSPRELARRERHQKQLAEQQLTEKVNVYIHLKGTTPCSVDTILLYNGCACCSPWW